MGVQNHILFVFEHVMYVGSVFLFLLVVLLPVAGFLEHLCFRFLFCTQQLCVCVYLIFVQL